MKQRNPYRIRIMDLVLAAAFVAAAVLIYVFAAVMVGHEAGNQAVILIDGSVYGTYDLSQGQEIEVRNDRGYNKIIIENGGVSMADADCPDHYCVASGRVTQNAQTIVCLPHRLVVEVRTAKTQQGVDAVVR